MTKDAVYAALAQAEGYVSGAALAKTLGVSRNSIFKAVKRLRGEGMPVEAIKKRGYRLLPDRALREEAIRAQLQTRALGRKLLLCPLLGSTNDTAKAQAAAGAPHGTVVVADRQTAGRGRRGRSFFSPPGCGVYMSVLLRQSLPAAAVGLLTSVAAVAVAEAIETLCPVDVQIKWVNDLLIDGKKLCGILTEGSLSAETGECDYAVIGIGINVATAQFPPALQPVATSLQIACGKPPARAALIAAVLNRLESAIDAMHTGAFLEESRRRSAVLGRAVTVVCGNACYPATAVDIDRQGRLVVNTAAGRRTLSSGEVSVRL